MIKVSFLLLVFSFNFTYLWLQFLLESQADPNARTADQWTPLHSACKWNNVECAEKLIEAGTDINAVTSGGNNYYNYK